MGNSGGCCGFTVAETNYTNECHTGLGKAEALENHVGTVTMRAGSFFTTESDFSQTILEQHEEARNQLNALSAQLRTAVAAPKADCR